MREEWELSVLLADEEEQQEPHQRKEHEGGAEEQQKLQQHGQWHRDISSWRVRAKQKGPRKGESLQHLRLQISTKQSVESEKHRKSYPARPGPKHNPKRI